MIYAAAFHIFHCFQVFGSICKIKFVMREHSPPSHTLPPGLFVPASLILIFLPRLPSPPSPRARESTHMADRPISSRAETPTSGCSLLRNSVFPSEQCQNPFWIATRLPRGFYRYKSCLNREAYCPLLHYTNDSLYFYMYKIHNLTYS